MHKLKFPHDPWRQNFLTKFWCAHYFLWDSAKTIWKTCQIKANCLVNSWLLLEYNFQMDIGFQIEKFLHLLVEKNPLKLGRGKEKTCLPRRAYSPWVARFSFHGLIFGGFFKPLGWKITIPETCLIQKSYIPPLRVISNEKSKTRWQGCETKYLDVKLWHNC